MQAADLASGKGHHDENFPVASWLLKREHRAPVLAFYRFARAADDIADNQELGGELGDQSDLAERLAHIRRLTALAFAGEPTGDPAFDALGVVAAEVGLTPQMAEDVIAGFQLDVSIL